MIRVDFQCVFETAYTLSLANGITPLLEKAEVDIGIGEGKVDLALGLWETETFQNPLPADAEISVPDKLHVAAVIQEKSMFNVYLDECWATPRFVQLKLIQLAQNDRKCLKDSGTKITFTV